MAYVTVGKENSTNIDLWYEDQGTGMPVVLIHGYPLSSASWEKQTTALLQAGFRVITFDRRGFGKSSKPATGYDYDTFASDLNALVTKLGLRDFALIGFSMGAGEVARFIGRFGANVVSKAVLIGGVTPFLLKTQDNPEGVEKSVFNTFESAISKDRFAFFTRFLRDFVNADQLVGKSVSEDVIRAWWNIAAESSPVAAFECVHTWYTDFRSDLARFDMPTLVIHGDADRIIPIKASGAAAAKLIKGSRFVTIPGGPHGITWTHWEQVNAELVNFLRQPTTKGTGATPAAATVGAGVGTGTGAGAFGKPGTPGNPGATGKTGTPGSTGSTGSTGKWHS